MISASDFFARRADAFRDGQLLDVSQTFLFPTPIFSGDQVTVMQSSDDLLNILSECRETLMCADYAYSQHAILSADTSAEDRARFKVRWTNWNRHGRVINRAEMVYFLTRTPEAGWLIAMIERLAMENSRLAFA